MFFKKRYRCKFLNQPRHLTSCNLEIRNLWPSLRLLRAYCLHSDKHWDNLSENQYFFNCSTSNCSGICILYAQQKWKCSKQENYVIYGSIASPSWLIAPVWLNGPSLIPRSEIPISKCKLLMLIDCFSLHPVNSHSLPGTATGTKHLALN